MEGLRGLVRLGRYSTQCTAVSGFNIATGFSNNRTETRRVSGARHYATVARGDSSTLDAFKCLDMSDRDEVIKFLRKNSSRRAGAVYVAEQRVADKVVDCLGGDLSNERALIMENNAGVGILTQALVRAGAQRVVALESQRKLLPVIEDIAGTSNGRVHAMYADFFKIAAEDRAKVVPPSITPNNLLADLPLAEWTDDVTVKVVGSFPINFRERQKLLQFAFMMLDGHPLFQKGRIELNVFMSEPQYHAMTYTYQQGDTSRKYQLISVLYQMCTDITLLHMEPRKSFEPFIRRKGASSKPWYPDDNICFVKITPKRDLFTHGVTKHDGVLFAFIVRLLLASPRSLIRDRLEGWNLDGERVLGEIGLPLDTRAVFMSWRDFISLVRVIRESRVFDDVWLRDEAYDFISKEQSISY